MAEVVHHMDPSVDRTELEAKTGGDILDGLHNSLKKAKKNTADGGAIDRVAADMFQVRNCMDLPPRSDQRTGCALTGINRPVLEIPSASGGEDELGC